MQHGGAVLCRCTRCLALADEHVQREATGLRSARRSESGDTRIAQPLIVALPHVHSLCTVTDKLSNLNNVAQPGPATKVFGPLHFGPCAPTAAYRIPGMPARHAAGNTACASRREALHARQAGLSACPSPSCQEMDHAQR